MYTNETPIKSVRVYPNRDAIKQMTLKSVCNEPRINSTPKHMPIDSQTSEGSSLKESLGCYSSDSISILLFLLMVMFFCPDDNDSTLFSVILAMLFIS